MTPDNKLINGLWISPDGKPLSNVERLCIYSFCANGHDFRLWTYGDLPNVPQDTAPGKVEFRDGNEILPQGKIFRRKGTLSHFSDWFRWELLRKFGGWWADVDIVCLTPIDFSDGMFFCHSNTKTIHTGLMKFPQGHYVAEAMAHSCAHPGRIMPWDKTSDKFSKAARALWFWKSAYKKQGFGEAGGPQGFSKALRHFNLFQNAKPSFITENIARFGLDSYFDDTLHRMEILHPLLKHSPLFHISNSGMEHYGYDKNGGYHPNSPFEILKRRYLPELRQQKGN